MRQDDFKRSAGCGCCRRDFLGAMGLAAGGMALNYTLMSAAERAETPPPKKGTAVVRGVFIYPPSQSLHGGWWSWPGNDFDAENRQQQYTARLEEIERKLGVRITMAPKPIYDQEGAARFVQEISQERPDGVLLIPFHNPTFNLMDGILEATKDTIPTIIFSCLGVKHGSIKRYQRSGVYFIQSLDNFDAVEYGIRMIKTRRLMKESRVLSVAGAQRKEAAVPFWGTQLSVVPIQQFVDEVNRTAITEGVKQLARQFVEAAKEKLEPTDAAVLTAARVHFALERLLEKEASDAVTMDCLRRGEYQPCMSFMTLRDKGVAAGCENDLYPTLTLMLLQHLFDRPGFQHNPAFETEANHYFASHCTSASKLFGPDGPRAEHLLRNFAHANDPTCVPQILFPEGAPVTMARLYPGEAPSMHVYTGKIVKSYAMPPVGGCRTNVEITINELADACDVGGHHNVLICGDYGKRLRRFAQLYGISVTPEA